MKSYYKLNMGEHAGSPLQNVESKFSPHLRIWDGRGEFIAPFENLVEAAGAKFAPKNPL